MFSCEFCKILKNTFFTEHLLETVSPRGYQKLELGLNKKASNYPANTCLFKVNNGNSRKTGEKFIKKKLHYL